MNVILPLGENLCSAYAAVILTIRPSITIMTIMAVRSIFSPLSSITPVTSSKRLHHDHLNGIKRAENASTHPPPRSPEWPVARITPLSSDTLTN